MKFIILLVLVVALFGSTEAQGRSTPYEDEESQWKVSVDELGKTAVLNCSWVKQPPDWALNSTYDGRWLLSNLTFIYGNSTTLGKHTIRENGNILEISDVQKADFGIYFCMRRRKDEQLWMVKRGLNLQGPYFENLSVKYRNNIIIGMSVFWGFLAFMAMVCGTYYFRWPKLEGKEFPFRRGGVGAEPALGKVTYVGDSIGMTQYDEQYKNHAYENDVVSSGAARI